jgi:hypothetical protein
MKTTTLAELVLSAQAAANKAVAVKDTLAQQTVKLEEFATSALDRADYPTWENAFHAQLDMLVNYARQDSPATAAAKAEIKKVES